MSFLFSFKHEKLTTKRYERLNVSSYSQSQTEDGGSIVKVVDHFIVGCVVHLYMPERKNAR